MRIEIRLSGSGGQGLLLAGLILAEAAGRFDGMECVQIQSYGPEARGGASKSDVIISDSRILYPKARQLDILMALSQESVDKFHSRLKCDGCLVMDDTLDPPPGHAGVLLPLQSTAIKLTGSTITTNMVGLGALCRLTKAVSKPAALEAIKARVPAGTIDMNLESFEAGFDMAPPRLKIPVKPEIEERLTAHKVK